MGGVFGLIRDIFTIYICFRLIGIWVFGLEFTRGVGVGVIILLGVATLFTLQRVGVVPSHK